MEALGNRLQDYLQKRKDEHLLRRLTVKTGMVDFSSNDYLGLSRSAYISQQVNNDLQSIKYLKGGSTGSRLLNGNSYLYEEVEKLLANAHHAEAALLFNSGFDVNVGLISTVVRPGDTIFYDEFVHASIHQGMMLSRAVAIPFRHNDLHDLEEKLANHISPVRFIITESVFSMEGDMADLVQLAKISQKHQAALIVDEAHATGIFGQNGSGLCNEAGIEDQCFARVYTLGKAIASKGGIVVGNNLLKEYLVNFSRNFIYSTALETASLLRVEHTYLVIQNNINQRVKLKNAILYFKERFHAANPGLKLCGEGPIFGIIIPGNKKCKETADFLQAHEMDIRAILSPTILKGKERLRIILHSFNTFTEIDRLIQLLSYQK